jgi:hypothetical protein
MNERLLRYQSRLEIMQPRRVVCLVCLLGVALSAALLPHVAFDQLGWVFAHLE